MAAPSYTQDLFPVDISRNAEGGPQFSTIVVSGAAGTEQRIAQWSMSRAVWDVSQALRTPAQMDTLIDFFQARQGKTFAFRFKDWSDYSISNEPLVVSGTPTVQLIKTYSSGSVSRVRNIYAPVASPAVTLRKNGGNFTAFTLSLLTGLVTLTTPVISKSITAITQASSAVVTVGGSHGFLAADVIYLSGISGMTQANGQVATVTSVGATTITVALDTTGYSAYVSGGVADTYTKTTDSWDWTGQYDLPARFDTDKMSITLEDVSIRSWGRIPIIEMKGT